MPKTIEGKSGGIHIFGLVAFAWSLPLFITFSESEDFFVSYGLGRWQMVGFALTVGLLIPGAIALLVHGLCGMLQKRDSPILGTAIAILVALALLPNMKKLPWMPGMLIVTLCVMAGVLAAHGYFRSSTLRSGCTGLAVLAPAYAFWFIAQSSIVSPSDSDVRLYQLSPVDDSPPPVVFVVFDQLSLQAILDDNKSINRETFPNFARLADRSHWFRNASTVAEKTTHAVPAILTGRYAAGDVDRAPTHTNHPMNAFTLFHQMGYDLFASERLTELCPSALNRMEGATLRWSSAARMFVSDIVIVSGHVYLSDDLAVHIPSLDGQVSNFAQRPLPRTTGAESETTEDLDYTIRRHRDFVSSLENEPGRFYMLHLMTPHHPYRFLSSGKVYIKDGPLGQNYIDYREDWPADPYHGQRDMQRYFHQAAMVDGLLGELLDRLETTGLLEDAIIVVTSDHGVSFRPNYGMRLAVRKGESRVASLNTAMDIIKTPAFIKLPHQNKAKVIDAPFQLIDILPTLVERIAGPIAPEMFDGRPMLAPEPSELDAYRLYSFNNASFVKHGLDVMDARYDVASKFDALDFDNGFAVRSDLYEYFRREPLVIPLAPDPALFLARLFRAQAPGVAAQRSNLSGAYIRANLIGDPAPEKKMPILITVNGKFGAVAMTFGHHSTVWASALVDETLLQPGENRIALYEIDTDATGAPVCRRIELLGGRSRE